MSLNLGAFGLGDCSCEIAWQVAQIECAYSKPAWGLPISPIGMSSTSWAMAKGALSIVRPRTNHVRMVASLLRRLLNPTLVMLPHSRMSLTSARLFDERYWNVG